MSRLDDRLNAALDQPERLAGFDRRVWSIRGKRLAAAAAHPHWTELRRQATAIKAHAITHLDELLVRFVARAESAGAHVHVALEGAQANAIVHRLLEARGTTRVTKSKSMTTEECELNPFLAERGITVVDTDLGERIVQLLGESPSHIVAPAIHLDRHEIGALFERELGADPGAHDPESLVAVARAAMREDFLAAEAGITGVNFAVAETGTIVVVENEGNSLLTTSVPALHIAVMGVEKLVPGLADLGVLLNVLARSATGQRLTSYTTHYTGPQRRGPGEQHLPPRQLHIVILDNGRSRVLARPALASALGCIRCGACLNVCPVYRRSLGHAYGWAYPGPIGSVLAPDMGPAHTVETPFASSLCGACSEACPVGIDLHGQLLARRAEVLEDGRRPRPVWRRLARLLEYPRLCRALLALCGRAPFLMRWSGRWLGRGWLADRGHGPTRLLPEPEGESFQRWWRRERGS